MLVPTKPAKPMRYAYAIVFFLITYGCQQTSQNDINDPDAASKILAEASAAIGKLRLQSLQEIYALADCEGPNGSFQTLVCSSRAGNVRFEQVSDRGTMILGIVDGSGWSYNLQSKSSDRIDSLTMYFIGGHELHMLAYLPEARLGHATYLGDSLFLGQPSVALQFRDLMAGPLLVHFSKQTKLPLGMTIKNHLEDGGEDIHTTFEEWEDVEGLQVFKMARFLQGDDEFTYHFTQVEFNSLPDSTFYPGTVF